MRTVKRESLTLNQIKYAMLGEMAQAFAQEKQYWLEQFQQLDYMPYIKHPRKMRDQAVKSNYQSPFQLQGRMWKLALEDAAEIMDKYWQGVFVEMKVAIKQSHLTQEQQHYAFWLLKDYRYFTAVMKSKAPLFQALDFRARMQVVY